jgi:NAD(P)-dependent dehydrogenase (short-subunit alcohol dehydrogenase family)
MDGQKVALVTGASSGFGLLAAVELGRRGLRVFASMRDLKRAERLDEQAREASVTVDKVQLDVTSEASLTAAIAEVERRAGRIDVLVNNAGFGMGGFFEDVALAELREQFETNFFGLVALTKAVVPGMRERRSGCIINVSSIGGRVALPGMSAYCASKFAVEGLSESLRHELRPFGVHVVLVEPGTFKTDIFDRNRRVAARMNDPASPYYERSKQMERVVDDMVGRSKADPNAVARVIADAATAEHPRLRYLVGVDAHGEAIARALFPFSWLEAGVARLFGLRQKPPTRA